MRELLRRTSNGTVVESLFVLLTCGYCLVVFFTSMSLGSLRFDVPMIYRGDALQYSYMIESASAPGGLADIANAGMPFGTQNIDFPNADATNLLIARAVAADGDFGRRFNLFFLVGIVLTTVSGYLVARSLGLNRAWSSTVAICFTLLPFHFLRVGHLFYTNYSAAAVGLWLCSRIGRPAQSEKSENRIRRFLPAAAFFAACFWCGTTGVYYAFFTCLILGVASVLNAVYRRSWRPIFLGGTALFLIVCCTAAQIAPTVRFESTHGPNESVAKRSFQESEIYGLRITQLLLPTFSHPLAVFAKIRQNYSAGAPLVNENDTASLGIAGSLGFLLAIALLLLPDVQRRLPWEVRLPAFLLLAMLLYATIGGFGSLFALLVTPQIRALNRISPFIGYAALLIGAGVLQQAFKNQRHRLYGSALALLIIPLATYDQVVYRDDSLVPGYQKGQALFDTDKKFAEALAASVPIGSRVLQLPFVEYPESGSAIEYAQFRNHLHAPHLNFTYGAMKGRPESNWLQVLTSLTPAVFADTLARTGFAAIVVDNRNDSARSTALIHDWIQAVDARAILSDDGTQTAYVAPKGAVINARAIAPERGWNGVETGGSTTWDWATGNASMAVSRAPRPADCRTQLILTSMRARNVDAIVDGSVIASVAIPAGGVGRLDFQLKSDAARIELKTDRPAAPPGNGDPRRMSFGWQLNTAPTCQLID